jgi:hypothetical protein
MMRTDANAMPNAFRAKKGRRAGWLSTRHLRRKDGRQLVGRSKTSAAAADGLNTDRHDFYILSFR